MTSSQDWVKPFRRQIWKTCIDGWNLIESRGRMRLQVREEGKKTQSLMLPYDWTEEGAARALPRIQQIFKRYQKENLSLAKAAQSVETSNSNQTIDWDDLFLQYRSYRPNANDSTWNTKYRPVLERTAAIFESKSKKPVDGTALMMKVLEKWEQGTRARQISRQCLSAFLNWAVGANHLKPCYLPPTTFPETRKPKRIGFALSDTQIIELLDAIPNEKWRFAIQILSVYGLRPEELRYLVVQDGKLKTTYQKSKGGTKGERTATRFLFPLFGELKEAKHYNWNLKERLIKKEALPPLGAEGCAGRALGTYLKRNKKWQQLKADAEAVSEVLVPYTFRHRYAKASHQKNDPVIPLANIASAMGHTIPVHLENYARFTPDRTAELYDTE